MKGLAGFEEALARPEPTSAEGDPLAERLRACSRLLDLAADEVAAHRRGDTARCRELAESREKLGAELFVAAEGSEGDDDGVQPSIAERIAALLLETIETLELREEEERRMQHRWSSLEEDALKAMHVGGRIISLRAGRYEDGPPIDARLDLRF